MRHWIQAGLSAVAVSVMLAFPAAAQDRVPQYDKLIKSTQSIGVLGKDLAGDATNFYTGATTFSNIDLAVPGNSSLPVSVGRHYIVEYTHGLAEAPHPSQPYQKIQSIRQFAFGDWELDIPYITGTFTQQYGWQNDSTTPLNRCSIIGQVKSNGAPATGAPRQQSNFNPGGFWSGNTLHVPGGDQSMLVANVAGATKPTTGGPYHWTTNQNWWVSCLPTLANASGANAGEGFLAIAPDGTKYWFNWISRRNVSAISETESLNEDGVSPPYRTYSTFRQDVFLMPTRIEDRFGNWVQYTYSSDAFAKLLSITSNDGRQLTLSYNASGYVSSVSDGTRTLIYSYSGSTLTTVTLPDNSAWQYSFNGLGGVEATSHASPTDPCYTYVPNGTTYGCIGYPASTANATAYVIHPSGARADFKFSTHFQFGGKQGFFFWTYPFGISEKTISGPNMPAQKWYYAFAPGPAEVEAQCNAGACPTRIWTDEVSPDYRVTRRMFGLAPTQDEGILLQVLRGVLPTSTTTAIYTPPTYRIMASLRGGSDIDLVDDNTPVSVTTTTVTGPPLFYEEVDYFYRLGARLGDNPVKYEWGDAQVFWSERRIPVSQRKTVVQNTTFNYTVNSWDGLDRALSVTRASSLGYSKTDVSKYYDHTGLWVLGQLLTSTNNNTGIVTSQVDYDTATAMPIRTYAFGKLQQTMGYNIDGTLATVKDGRNLTTTLSQWYRGIPRRIDYADGNYQTASVNPVGWVTSVVDENGFSTGYGYDASGRLASIVYPTGDAVAWNNMTRNFRALTGSDWMPSGVSPGQWRLYEATGNHVTITYFDVMWLPILKHDYDAGNVAATLRATSTSYDGDGRAIFASYSSDIVNPPAVGVRTSYDALGRVSRVQQDSELGALNTTTEYLDGFQSRLTNPRGFQTTSGFVAYDDATMDAPAWTVLPGGAVTEIYRDMFGKPTLLRRRDAASTQIVDRRYVYDGYQQLCKTIEPETGSTAYGYDAAGNLAWSAAGLSLPDAGNCNASDAWGSGRRVDRSYDNRNRLTILAFPDGRGNQTLSYTPDGLPASITTYNDPGNGAAVVNAYTYNRRRMLVGESSGQPGWYSWGIGYGYDANGSLATQSYPTGLNVGYAPNALGQPTAVTSTDGWTYASGVSYYPNGAIKQFTYGNGIVHTMSQNARQLPARSTDAGVIDYESSFDANANATAVLDRVRGDTYSRWMTYDGLDRLTDAGSCSFGGDCWHRFTYDAVDNLKSWKLAGVKDYATYYYDSSNRLTNIQNSSGASVVGLGYDVQGNLANKNGQTYQFDYGNRLRASTSQEWYRYDGQGRRVLNWRWNESGVLSQYSLGGQLVYDENYRASGRKANEYVYLGGSLLTTRSRNIDTGAWTVTFQHTDGLGSPVAVTNTSGQVVDRTDYEPFGAAIGKPAYDGIGYTGHVQDGATGLTYAQQRYFDSSIGRFLSVDPVTADSGTGANFNRYWYANNNPYAFTDPDGRQSRRERHEQNRRESFCNTGCDSGSFFGDSGNSSGVFGNLGSLLSKVSNGEHRYFNQTWACNDLFMLGCNEANLFDNGLLYHSAPALDGEKRLAQNEIRLVLPLGYVRFTVDRQHWTIINHTTPNHALREGFVVRQIVRQGHDLLIQTRGYGKGALPAVNNYLNLPVWQTVDLNMLRSVNMSPGR